MEKSPTQWMVTPLQKYADFNGRARRAEYWWSYLAVIIALLLALIVDTVLGLGSPMTGIGPFYGLVALGILVPSLAVSVRRLHDTDRSGWYLLIGLIPLVGAIVLLVWFCSRGTVGPNTYGPDPLVADAAFT